MLAGTVYYYNDTDILIEKMDLDDYEEMSHKSFLKYTEEIGAVKVTIGSLSNNHQREERVEVIYLKNNNQTQSCKK
jgi:hypothetical protein